MIDPRCDLLSRILKDIVAELQAGVSPDQSWAAASKAVSDARMEDDIELFVAVEDFGRRHYAPSTSTPHAPSGRPTHIST